jgi:hypothetical protein
LRDVIVGQSGLLDQMTRNVASTDKTLETISTKMDAIAFAIKDQHNFNKMIESQLAQLAACNTPGVMVAKIGHVIICIAKHPCLANLDVHSLKQVSIHRLLVLLR